MEKEINPSMYEAFFGIQHLFTSQDFDLNTIAKWAITIRLYNASLSNNQVNDMTMAIVSILRKHVVIENEKAWAERRGAYFASYFHSDIDKTVYAYADKFNSMNFTLSDVIQVTIYSTSFRFFFGSNSYKDILNITNATLTDATVKNKHALLIEGPHLASVIANCFTE